MLLSVSQYRGIVPRSELTGREGRADTLEGYKRIRPGQIGLNKMGLWRHRSLSLRRPCKPCIHSSPATTGVDARFYTYLYRTPLFIGEIVGQSAQIQRTKEIGVS